MAHYAWVLEVRPGYEDEYKKRHDEIWPELVEDIRAAGLRPMIQVKPRTARLKIAPHQVIELPFRRIIHLQRHSSKRFPSTGQDLLGVPPQGFEQLRGSARFIGQAGKCGGRFQRKRGKRWRAFAVLRSVELLLHPQAYLARAHRPKPVPVPADFGKFASHAN